MSACPLTREQMELLVLDHQVHNPGPGDDVVELRFRPAYGTEVQSFFVSNEAVQRAISAASKASERGDSTARTPTTRQLSRRLYRLANEMRQEEGCTTMDPAIVEAAAMRLDEQALQLNALRARSRADDLVGGKFFEPFGVRLPVGIPSSWYTTVVVQKYALGRGVAIERERSNLAHREGTLELEAHGKFLTFDRLVCEKANRRVLTVQGYIAAIRQSLQAEGEEEHPELERIAAAHSGTPVKTAILQLPPATGKTTVAAALALWLGCIHIVDEWCPGETIVEGALHLTNAAQDALS